MDVEDIYRILSGGEATVINDNTIMNEIVGGVRRGRGRLPDAGRVHGEAC